MLKINAILNALHHHDIGAGVLYDPKTGCRCAVGQLLIDAFVDPLQLVALQISYPSTYQMADACIKEFGPVLEKEYGITDSKTLVDIMNASDTAGCPKHRVPLVMGALLHGPVP